MRFDLLDNAIASIEMGIEDYGSPDERRLISALRNLHAGALLLLKQGLNRESPPNSNDALIRERLVPVMGPDNKVVWLGDGTRTIGLGTIKVRYKRLGWGTIVDWERLKRLAEIRNEAEHHQLSKPKELAREALAACFVVVKEVIEKRLFDRPEELLSSEVWKIMLAESTTFESLAAQCRESIAQLLDVPQAARRLLERLECPECGSTLLEAEAGQYIDAVFHCRCCADRANLASVIVPAVSGAFGPVYEKKIGFVEQTADCPSCSEHAFLIAEDLCLVCLESRPYPECAQCGCSLSIEEQDDEFCSGCNRPAYRDDD